MTRKIVLADFVGMAHKATQAMGAGIFAINTFNDSTSFMSGSAIEADIEIAKQDDDDESIQMLTKCLEKIDSYNPKTHVLLMVITEEDNTISEVPLPTN